MKVVKSKTPKEEVKVTNLFWEPYEVSFEEGCCDGKEEYLQEEIMCLAEDIIDITDNFKSMVEDLNYNFDAIQHNENNRKNEIKKLDEKIEKVDDAGMYLFRFLVVWNFVLSGVLAYYVF